MTQPSDLLRRLKNLKLRIAEAHRDRNYKRRNRLCAEHDALVLEIWASSGFGATKDALLNEPEIKVSLRPVGISATGGLYKTTRMRRMR